MVSLIMRSENSNLFFSLTSSKPFKGSGRAGQIFDEIDEILPLLGKIPCKTALRSNQI